MIRFFLAINLHLFQSFFDAFGLCPKTDLDTMPGLSGKQEVFRRQKIPFIAQQILELFYKGDRLVQVYKPDFVCYEKIIVVPVLLSTTQGGEGTIEYVCKDEFGKTILLPSNVTDVPAPLLEITILSPSEQYYLPEEIEFAVSLNKEDKQSLSIFFPFQFKIIIATNGCGDFGISNS